MYSISSNPLDSIHELPSNKIDINGLNHDKLSSMPLSRHFYSLDEVHAALHYATTRNDRLETLFWCDELILSDCAAETISTLFESWLWNKGPFQLSWLLTAFQTLASEEVSEQDILRSAYQLSSIPHTQQDHSVWKILAMTAAQIVPDRVTPRTPYLPSSDQREIYFVRALYQGKAYSAWWMSRHFTTDRLWALLEEYVKYTGHASLYAACLTHLRNYDQLLGYRTSEYDIVVQCVAVCAASLSPLQRSTSFAPLSAIDPMYQARFEEWKSSIGRKWRRIYSIPTACLYGRTQRGSMSWKESTVYQLNRVENHLVGCPFWDTALSEYATLSGSHIQWNSDDSMEAFYDRYFPDDIPDEWTKAEKAVSHGDGRLSPTESLQFSKYARLYFSKWSRLAWNSNPLIPSISDYHPTSIVSLFPIPSSLPSIPLEPVHRHPICGVSR